MDEKLQIIILKYKVDYNIYYYNTKLKLKITKNHSCWATL